MVAFRDTHYKSLYKSLQSTQEIQFIAINVVLHVSRNYSVKEPQKDFEQECHKVWHI